MAPRPDREEWSLGRDRFGRKVTIIRVADGQAAKWTLHREAHSQLDETVNVYDLTDEMIRKLADIGSALAA